MMYFVGSLTVLVLCMFIQGHVNCHIISHQYYTHDSILTIHVVCTSVSKSAVQHVGELLLGSRDGVNPDSFDKIRSQNSPSHHHCVLQFNGAGIAANGDIQTQNK